MPEDLQKLVWWLFPSQVQSELMNLKSCTFEQLEQMGRDSQNDDYSTYFRPKDYNRGKFKMTIDKEYIGKAFNEDRLDEVEEKEEE